MPEIHPRLMVNRSKAKGTATLTNRLYSRTVVAESGCWEWMGSRTPNGYGQIGLGSRAAGLGVTHRISWEIENGPIPEGMWVLHKCDNRPCMNPDHLFLGTHRDNMDDMLAKGRGARGKMLPHTKLTDDQVREIRSRYVRSYGPPKRGGRKSNADELAREYGLHPMYVMQIVHRRERGDVLDGE